MDVRCEKCQTEYELDESRLKPGGVTVKCTTCGHMFKIRKRSPTQSGIPVVKAGAGSGPTGVPRAAAPARASEPVPRPAPRQESRPEPRPETRTVPERPDGRAEARAAVPRAVGPEARPTGPSMPPPAAEGDRAWIIRMENGESRTCRELGTLQQWIITGQVSRESMISRSGKTWKRLGDIAELTSFFTVADEAQHVRAARGDSAAHRHDFDRDEEDTRPAQPLGPPPERRTALGPAAAPLRAAAPAPAPRVLAAAPAPLPAAPTPRAKAPTPPPPAPVAPAGERKTAGWAAEGVPPSIADDGSGDGPRRGAVRPSDSHAFGGVVRPVPTDDVAFAAGLGERGEATMDFDDEPPPARRGAGLWIALGSIIVIGGAVAAVYFLVLAPKGDRGRNAAVVIDAASPVVAGPVDAAVATPDPIDGGAGASLTALVDDARVQLSRDTVPALIAAGRALADGGGDAAAGQALRARLLTAQAQIINDEADLAADPASADKVRRDGKQLVLDALTLAQKALKQSPTDADANLAMADVLRLQGKSAAEVKRYLSAVKGDAAVQREVALIAALLDLRDKQAAKAKDALTKLDSGAGALEATGDVRARWRLAVIAAAAKQADAARTAAEAVLAAQPDHAGARALLAKVAAVATDDPMPPEDGSGGGSGTGASPGSATGSGSGTGGGPGTGASPGSGSAVVHGGGGDSGPSAGEGYDRLLAKANKLAEVSCGQAIPYYQKALEAKPNSVEALTGMGYCHLDAKQFSSAHSKFRAALGISPRYERALWGVAEMYQQQGRAADAIEAYKAYLEVYPKSVAAQRQLDRLQGKASGTPTPPDDDGPSTGPTTTPTPPADPPPPPPSEPRPDLPAAEPQTTP